MTRGTTPTLVFTFDNFEYSNIVKAELTIQQSGANVIIKPLTVAEDNVYCELSEVETLSLDEGQCKLQIKMMLQDGNIIASNVINSTMKEILNEERFGND